MIQENGITTCVGVEEDDDIRKCEEYFDKDNSKSYLTCKKCEGDFNVFPNANDGRYCK